MLEIPTSENYAMMADGGQITIVNQRKNWVPNLEKKMRSSLPTVTSHITQGRSVGNYMKNLVIWKCKNQSVVAEAKFQAMAQRICGLLWLKIILEDLKIKWDEPMGLYCDNESAIIIAP